MNVVIWNQKNDTPGCWVPKTDQEMLDCTTWWWSPLWIQVSNPSTQLSKLFPSLLSVNTGMNLTLPGVKTAAGWVKHAPPKLLWCKRAVTVHRLFHFLQVGPLTTPLVTQCLCNHLTFFGSSFFIMPNVVDVSRTAELFSTFTNNPVVVCFVGAIFAVYLLVITWARRKDIQDSAKVEEDFTWPNRIYFHWKRIFL